jgi:hypothetical protein
MKFFNNYNEIYLIPTIGLCYERKFNKPWEFHYFFVDLRWLKWGIEITIKDTIY